MAIKQTIKDTIKSTDDIKLLREVLEAVMHNVDGTLEDLVDDPTGFDAEDVLFSISSTIENSVLYHEQ